MKCVILGAGKIARGFIGHILYLSNIPFTFVEKAEGLVDLINERGQYTVNILGDSSKNCVVKGVKAIPFTDVEKIAEEISESDVVFTSVGGKNLGDLVPLLAKGIEKKVSKGGYLNVVTCENWKQPAEILRKGVGEVIAEKAKEFFVEKTGFTEAVIMRSGIEADAELLKQDPLVVNVQDFWELPVDASRLAGPMPPLPELRLIEEFTGFLERKFYTYNAANGTTSFVGALLGFEKIGPEMFSLFKGKVSNAGDDRNKKTKMGWNIGIVSNQVLVTLVITQIANHMPHYCHIQFISRLKKKRKL